MDFRDIDNIPGFYLTAKMNGTLAQSNGNYGHIFTTHTPCDVMWICAKWAGKGSDAGTVTLDVRRVVDGQAVSGGTSLLKTLFNLKATEDTNYEREGVQLKNTQLNPGEGLGLYASGTLTDLANVVVTLYLKQEGFGFGKLR